VSRAYYPRAGAILKVYFEDFAGGASNSLYTLEVIPKRVEISRNSHREADTFRLELDYRDFPFDPRGLKDIHVRILLGDTEDPAQQLAADVDRFQAFIGYVDTPEVLLEEGEVVTLTGRDYTGQWLDQKWDGRAIDISDPLSEVVRNFAQFVPGMEDGFVEYSYGASNVVLAEILGRTKFSPKQGDDCWTILVDLCGRAGLLPLFSLDRLMILSASDFNSRGNTIPGISPVFGARRPAFLYGSNVARLTFKRRFNEARTKQIEVRCWDPQKCAYSFARYPTTPIVLKKKISTKGKVHETDAPILPWYVTGSYTEAKLSEMAKAIYEEVARQQIQGELETAEMLDLDGQTSLPLVGNGDGLVVRLQGLVYSSIEGMSDSEALAFLTTGPRALDANLAQALLLSRKQSQQLASTFYVLEAKHSWDRDNGYKMSCTFTNYV